MMMHQKPSVSILHRPSLSSLELQISLYYNSLYSLIFVVLIAACAVNKVNIDIDIDRHVLCYYRKL